MSREFLSYEFKRFFIWFINYCNVCSRFIFNSWRSFSYSIGGDMSLYDDLGVDQETSQGGLKRAFKHKAGKTHPDKKGGDTEAFKQIQKAYSILSNLEKKKRYDETGQTNTTSPLRQQAVNIIGKLFIEATQKHQLEKRNYWIEVKVSLLEVIQKDKAILYNLTVHHDKLFYLVDNSKGDSLLINLLYDQVKHLENQKNQCSEHILVLEDALLVVESCSYQGENSLQINSSQIYSSYTTTNTL